MFINTDRELAIVFSTYDTFEIRTLEAFDSIYEISESARVDKSIRFLVSADSAIETSIRHFLDQAPEYPIVIPVTMSDLSARGGQHLTRSIRRNYAIRNLFGFQSPLREEHFFFGRDQLVKQVVDLAKSGQNSTFFGLRKSGKTSTIYAINRRARSSNLLVVNIDCQDLAVHGRKFDELLSYVSNRVRQVAGVKKAEFSPGLTPPEISERFADGMRSIIGQVKQPIIIIFDEIENISPLTAASEHWRSGLDPVYFWQVLRSFIQSQTDGKLSVCIVGTSPHLIEAPYINEIDNPIYLFAEKRFIPNLSFEDTTQMVQRLGYFMGLTFPPAVTAALHMTYGGHPFFTRQICSTIHQLAPLHRPVEVSMNLLRQAEVQFGSQLEEYVRDIVGRLSKFYPDEFDLLRRLVSGDTEGLSFFASEAPELVDHLLGYGLIVKRGSDFDVAFEAIAHAVRHIDGRKESHGNDAERWGHIAARRGIVEQAIRKMLFFASKSMTSEEWNTLVASSLSKHRFGQLSSTLPAKLLSSDDSPLYLTDLMGFIKDSRLAKNVSNYEVVMMSLRTINDLRKDAHGKSISDAEFNEVCRALDCIEQEFVI